MCSCMVQFTNTVCIALARLVHTDSNSSKPHSHPHTTTSQLHARDVPSIGSLFWQCLRLLNLGLFTNAANLTLKLLCLG